MGFLEAMPQNPKSQNEPKNHKHCDYENEDLCCFSHIAHFRISFSGFSGSESERLTERMGVVGFVGSFSSSSHGEEDERRE